MTIQKETAQTNQQFLEWELTAEWEKQRQGGWQLISLQRQAGDRAEASQTKAATIEMGVDEAAEKLQRALNEFSAGQAVNWRRTIDYELMADGRGTDFQRAVWREIEKIPRGTVTTYGAIAKKIGRPRAYRAVGSAVGKNPLPLLVPCHRVLAANDQLGGFGWGIKVKKQILMKEGWQIIRNRLIKKQAFS